jgi:transposase
MLKLPSEVRVYLSLEPCDMRRQIDGLAAAVRTGMSRDPESGDLYLFRNRRGDMVKALFVDLHGYCMLVKRLSKGTFRIKVNGADASSVEMDARELAVLLSELTFVRELKQLPLETDPPS